MSISRELMIQRYKNGIQLIRPSKGSSSIYTVADLLNLPKPLLVYFYNRENVFQEVNEALVETNGFMSAQDAIGKSMFAVAKEHVAKQFNTNNMEVMNHNKIKIIEEFLQRKDDQTMLGLSIKSPWYNEHNEIIGVFGCSFVLDAQPISESLLHVVKLGLLDPRAFTTHPLATPAINGNRFSSREMQCLRLCARGKSAKETAKLLTLSRRTVENYLATIKSKMGVSTKSELIDKSLDYFKDLI